VSPSSPRLGRLIIAFNPAPPHSEPIACSDRPRPDGFCRNRSRCARLFPRWKSSVASALAAAVCCRRRLWVPSGPLHNWLDPAAGQRSGACERANMTTPKIREPMWARERMSTCAQPSHPTDELAKSGPYGCHDRYIGTIPKAGPEGRGLPLRSSDLARPQRLAAERDPGHLAQLGDESPVRSTKGLWFVSHCLSVP
jgi:hypothetical protein